MRRTYRSKKDTGGALDHRDVLQNLDEKSSAFDAYYIQNIKQTKRELSCIGPSTGFGVASNQVRKRKYVKRIVDSKLKEDESVVEDLDTCKESSTYLTPDKSIRVNKILDPFDMLLNTSSHGEVVYKSPALQTLVAKKPSKTYTKKKSKPVKKFNYSSNSSSESDKENVSTINSNTTDIRRHELVVEKLHNSPKNLDESVNKLVNNTSLINILKRKTVNSSFNTSYKYRNRLASNFHSPILQKSPLCSTPFKEKYRGKSIYAFSPITTKAKDSPTHDNITEENNESNNSIILPYKERNIKDMPSKLTDSKPSINMEVEKSLIYDDIEIINTSDLEGKIVNSEKCEEKSLIYDSVDEIEPVQCNSTVIDLSIARGRANIIQSICDSTHVEPFLGFSTITEHEMNTKQDLLMKLIECNEHKNVDESDSKQDLTPCQGFYVSGDNLNKSKTKCLNDNDEIDNPDVSMLAKEFINSNNDDCENDSKYDTCNSDQDVSEEVIDFEPKVNVHRLNDSVFLKYYKKMLVNQQESLSSDYYADDHDKSNASQEEKNAENTNSEFDESDNYSSLSNSKTDKSNDTENESSENPNILISDSSTTEENMESNTEAINEDIHISFVTTRRRNEIVNDSLFIFNNSYGSSSTDCDKTVLSNKARLSHTKSDYESDVGTNDLSVIEAPNNRNVKDINKGQSNRSSTTPSKCNTQTDFIPAAVEPLVIEDSSDDNALKESPKKNKVLNHTRSSVTTRKSSRILNDSLIPDRASSICVEAKPSIVLRPGKKWERSLSIYRRMTTMADHFDSSILEDESLKRGRKFRQSVISTMEMQDSPHNESINSRRSTFISKPCRSTIRFVKDSNNSRISLNTTEIFDDLKGFLNEECDDTVIELSKLSLAESEFEVTVLDKFNESSERIATARDYVLRRCNQTEPLIFDECYPETLLKNCHKIGEGVYGEVFLLRGRDGRARVMKIVPIAGTVKVNGETQKDFHEVISEIVIAMELSALRAPIPEIDRYFDEGNDVKSLDLHSVENGTDVFNEVLAVRCVQGPYPSRLLDLWELYDECKGSENDNPAALPADQQFIVLELANAGQDLESYQFTGAQQAHALFQQIAFGLAVGEESFQFEHRDLHWGNVLIAPTEQKVATFVLNGRTYRVPRGGVAATIIDYSLSRVTLPLASDHAALYNDLAADEQLFDAVGDYQFQVYRLMRDKLGNDWKNFEPYTNILWLHYTVDKMITALRYKRTNTKIHKHYIDKLQGIKDRILAYKSATEYVLTDIEI